MRPFIFLLISCGILLSCAKDDNDFPLSPDTNGLENPDTTLSFKDFNGIVYHPFMADDKNLYVIFPNETNFQEIEFIPNKRNPAVLLNDGSEINGVRIDLSDFTKPLSCLWLNDKGDTLTKKIIVLDLPVITIDTPDSLPITSKTERKEGCIVKLITPNNEIQDLGTAGIRGRGNATWKQEKKPYNVKLDKKASILGMKSSKHWILLANAYYDRTQIHNSTAFEIARLTDFPWVQSGTHVELFLNGEYRGLYYLCEKIRSEKGKIELSSSNAETPVEECSYLLESYVTNNETDTTLIDLPFGYFHTDLFYLTGRLNLNRPSILSWEIKEPEDFLTQSHVDYIKQELRALEKMIWDDAESGRYRNFFDIESAINWYLVQRLCLNDEAELTKNCYLYRTGGGKFTVGPPWDFDAWTFGQIPFEDHGYWDLKNALYFKRLFADPVFVKRFKDKWNEYKQVWELKIPMFIEEQYNKIHRSAERNEIIWSNWNARNNYPDISYRQCVDIMQDAFISQLHRMDDEVRNIEDNKKK